MTQLKGEAALAFHKQLKQRAAEDRAARLQAAKAQAELSGKETFDLHKLERLCDTTERGRLVDVAERTSIYEYMYYVEHPQAQRLDAFASSLSEIEKWS
jgi:hypothetical protein